MEENNKIDYDPIKSEAREGFFKAGIWFSN